MFKHVKLEVFKLLYIIRHKSICLLCITKESKMAINVDNLTINQAKDYYLSYLNGTDDTGIGAQVAKSSKWNGFLSDWESDNTDYEIDQKNLHSEAAGTSLGFGAASALGSVTGGVMGGGNSALAGAMNMKKGDFSFFSGDKPQFVNKNLTGADKYKKNNIEGGSETGPGSTAHAIIMAVSAALGMVSMFITRSAQKKSIADQNKVIQQTQKEFEYDFNAKMMEADEQKEFAAMQYENALAVIEENEGHAALSDAVSGALAESNKGLSEIAANQSSQIRSETGQELTEIADDIYANGGTIPNNVNEFSKKIEISNQMVPYAQQAVSVDKQNKIAMYLSVGSAAITGIQCAMGMAMTGVRYWNYIIYGVALAAAITTGIMAAIEAKKAAEAQGKAELFEQNSEMLNANAVSATAEAEVKQSEYDDFATEVSNLSQSFGGTGGQVQTGNGLA